MEQLLSCCKPEFLVPILLAQKSLQGLTLFLKWGCYHRTQDKSNVLYNSISAYKYKNPSSIFSIALWWKFAFV